MPDETNATDQPLDEQDKGILRQFGEWCKTHKLVIVLLVIIALQQYAMVALIDKGRKSIQAALDSTRGMERAENEALTQEVCKLMEENDHLKKENGRLKKELELRE